MTRELPEGFGFRVVGTDSQSRAAVAMTPHGDFATPAFFPVGTRGAVRTLDARDLTEAGATGLLANAYHLMLRPGTDVVCKLGGLHSFMGWERPILTDSGGFQAMSLSGAANDRGIDFKSVYDGSVHTLTPENAIAIQADLGPDFAVALDECPRLPAPAGKVREAMQRSLRWAEVSRSVHSSGAQALVGVVQGGIDPALRAESARRMVEIGFDVYAIGGLAVGEPVTEMIAALDVAVPELPENRIRYLMGVGDPYGMVEAVARGVDLFDSVMPTRLARHGTALTSTGRVNARASRYTSFDEPIDPSCECRTCSAQSAGYLRHLLTTGEETGKRLLSIHNLCFVFGVLEGARDAIRNGRFGDFRRSIATVWGPGSEGSVEAW